MFTTPNPNWRSASRRLWQNKMAVTLYPAADVLTAAEAVYSYIVNGSVSGKCVERWRPDGHGGHIEIMVFEKYLYRTGSRAALTVAIDDFTGRTRVHCVGSGGGNGVFFSFDWGAAASLEQAPARALEKYL